MNAAAGLTLRAFLAIFWRQVGRDLRRHPLLTLLNVASIALGASVYLAIQLANGSAARSFEAGVDLVTGKAHLEIRGAIDESLFPKVRGFPGIRAATPMIEGIAVLPEHPGEYLHLLGVDVFTNSPFQSFQWDLRRNQSFEFEPWLRDASLMAIPSTLAASLGVHEGDPLKVRINGNTTELHAGYFYSAQSKGSDEGLRYAVMDIAAAQELLGMQGKLSGIQLLLEDPAKLESMRSELLAMLPPGLEVTPPAGRSVQVQKMLGAFRLNLTALSMVSMLVGMFLVYNTVTASVARRTREIGILRSIGASRVMVASLFLGEATLFAFAGSILGVAGGIALAHGLVGSVSKTISSLYVLVDSSKVHVDPWQILIAVVLTFAGALLAAFLPAQRAAAIDPARVLAGRDAIFKTRSTTGSSFAGIGLLGLAGISSWGALQQVPWLSFAAAFFVLTGFALFTPALATLLVRAVRRLPASITLLQIASGNLQQTIWRAGITAAALGSALAMFVGVTVMTYSFRRSVDSWIQRTVVADLFVAPADNQVAGLHSFVAPEVLEWFRARPEIAFADTYRQMETSIAGQPAVLALVSGAERRNLDFRSGADADVFERFTKGEGIFVSEPFSRKQKVQRGESVTIETPSGRKMLPVLGIYSDYTKDAGVVLLPAEIAGNWWGDHGVHSLAITLKPGSAIEPMLRDFRAGPGLSGVYSTYSNGELRRRILEIFDQTFAVTDVLRAIAVFVAVAGIVLSFGALVLERQRAIGVLRAIGSSAGQVAGIFLWESALVSLNALLMGLAAGMTLACVLTYVVNPAFFGWTIRLEWPIPLLVTTPLWILPASLVAVSYPAWKAAQIPPARALRFE